MFSLGLLSLDTTNLEVLQEAGDESERKYAKSISPLRHTGNLLLCTLLLGNTLVNALLSIMLAQLLNSVLGFVLSTALILIFGEIIPQATCSRYSLWVGAHTIYLTKLFMVILLPLTFPISWCLNRLLGSEIGILYSRSELKRLIEIHVQKQDVSEQGVLDAEDHNDQGHVLVHHALVPVSRQWVPQMLEPVRRLEPAAWRQSEPLYQ